MTDPEQADDEAVPRTISMTWGDVCDTEVGFVDRSRGKNSSHSSRITPNTAIIPASSTDDLAKIIFESLACGDILCYSRAERYVGCSL